MDLLHRYPGFVEKLVFFDTVPPFVLDDFVAAGIDISSIRAHRRRADGRLPLPAGRDAGRAGSRARHTGQAQAVHRRDVRPPAVGVAGHVHRGRRRLHDRTVLPPKSGCARAGPRYQLAHGRPQSEPPILDRKVDVPTLILYGMDDHVVGPDFLHTCEVAFTNRTGPVVLPGAGHFLQWERADLFNPAGDRVLRGPACSPRAIGSGATLSASTLMYRVLGGRRPRPLPAPATTARGHGRMPNTC